jgi:uncharacterized protein (DUF433 family)
MPLPCTERKYEHVLINESGIPTISETNMKVAELILEKTAYGWSPEELHFQHPYLTLGQIHSALAYYYDHQEEVDADIERRLLVIDQTRKKIDLEPLTARLKSKGLIQ